MVTVALVVSVALGYLAAGAVSARLYYVRTGHADPLAALLCLLLWPMSTLAAGFWAVYDAVTTPTAQQLREHRMAAAAAERPAVLAEARRLGLPVFDEDTEGR